MSKYIDKHKCNLCDIVYQNESGLRKHKAKKFSCIPHEKVTKILEECSEIKKTLEKQEQSTKKLLEDKDLQIKLILEDKKVKPSSVEMEHNSRKLLDEVMTIITEKHNNAKKLLEDKDNEIQLLKSFKPVLILPCVSNKSFYEQINEYKYKCEVCDETLETATSFEKHKNTKKHCIASKNKNLDTQIPSVDIVKNGSQTLIDDNIEQKCLDKNIKKEQEYIKILEDKDNEIMSLHNLRISIEQEFTKLLENKDKELKLLYDQKIKNERGIPVCGINLWRYITNIFYFVGYIIF